MTTEHPITPPPELVELWYDSIPSAPISWKQELATQAARWGADQELEACCKWVDTPINYEDCRPGEESEQLRAARRPKPPSLAEEGQRILVENGSTLDGRVELDPEDVATIRAALERLQELEKGDE